MAISTRRQLTRQVAFAVMSVHNFRNHSSVGTYIHQHCTGKMFATTISLCVGMAQRFFWLNVVTDPLFLRYDVRGLCPLDKMIPSTYKNFQFRKASFCLAIPNEDRLVLTSLRKPNTEPSRGVFSVERQQAYATNRRRRESQKQFCLNPCSPMQPEDRNLCKTFREQTGECASPTALYCVTAC
jgi:hypothetical protein